MHIKSGKTHDSDAGNIIIEGGSAGFGRRSHLGEIGNSNSGNGGVILLQTGSGGEIGSTSSGNLLLQTGITPTGSSGGVTLESGGSTGGHGGHLHLLVGDGDVGNGGDVAISAGTTWSIGNEGGIVAVYGGEGDSGGDIMLQGGEGERFTDDGTWRFDTIKRWTIQLWKRWISYSVIWRER